MGPQNNQDENIPDTSTTTFTALTPPTEATFFDGHWDGAVPWYGNTYMILEKASGRAITRTHGTICLRETEGPSDDNRWLCINSNNYFGFQNPKSGQYMGHDGNYGLRASAADVLPWERFTLKRHPDGGYQLLVPHWWHSLRVVTTAEDGRSLVTRPHGTTLWEFVRV
ncbi:hypothetical protein F4819DRAFT_464137 [Hypoxylon fuscum]|nr:hypothetical protein F4819DRAFT_464137 [Hypoxylon fuscum]